MVNDAVDDKKLGPISIAIDRYAGKNAWTRNIWRPEVSRVRGSPQSSPLMLVSTWLRDLPATSAIRCSASAEHRLHITVLESGDLCFVVDFTSSHLVCSLHRQHLLFLHEYVLLPLISWRLITDLSTHAVGIMKPTK